MLSFQVSNSVTDEHGFGYLATDLYEVPTAPDDTEVIATDPRAFSARCWIRRWPETCQDLITVAMLLRAYHMAKEGELPSQLTDAML